MVSVCFVLKLKKKQIEMEGKFIDDCKVFDFVGDVVEYFILLYICIVVIFVKFDDYQVFFFVKDSLVDVLVGF